MMNNGASPRAADRCRLRCYLVQPQELIGIAAPGISYIGSRPEGSVNDFALACNVTDVAAMDCSLYNKT